MKWIGVDEAGKGDYFGYLVIAGVYVNNDKAKRLKAIGVKDSKMLSDSTVARMATAIKRICRHEIVRISPEKYNLLYKKFNSLNKLLAWGHARVIENLLERNEADFVITDKFGDESLLKKTLFQKGRKTKIHQRVRAESDTAVAAASVLARAEFLKTLKQLSLEVGYSLPKGATHVKEAAKELVKKYDEGILDFATKRHFKITKQVLAEK